MRPSYGKCVLLSLLLWPGSLTAQDLVDFSGYKLRVTGTTALESYMGAEALRMRGGRAVLEGVEIEDGIIEFDIATSGHRSFSGVLFRVLEGQRNGEYVYLRPHQGDRFDALQYTPLDSGLTAWQLYPEYNAQASIPANEWIHVKLEIHGTALNVFAGDAPEPVLTAELQRGHTKGGIVLLASAPSGGGLSAPEDTWVTAFANLKVEQRPRAQSAHGDRRQPDPRIIQHWSLSPVIVDPEVPLQTLPAETYSHGDWVVGTPDHTGRLNIARYRAMPPDADRAMVLASVDIRSDRPQTKRLNFGFSDQVSIFLNGDLIYTANNSYLARSGRYLGTMTLENDALYLPLRRGENELTFAVTETFGGWGLVTRFGDMDGLELIP